MKSITHKLSFQIGFSVAVIIILVELFILAGSYKSKKNELRTIADHITAKVDWPEGVVALSDAEIDERLQGFLQNVSFLVLIIVFVTVAGSVAVFNLLAGNKIRKLIDEKPVDIQTGIQNEITHLIEKKNAMISEMRQLSSVGEMAAGICHEIVSPLSIIHAVGRAKVRSSKDEGVKKSFETIIKASDRIDAIVRGMRAMVQGHDSDDFEAKEVLSIILDAKTLAQSRTQFQGVSVKIIEIDQDFSVECRPGQIAQIVLNLINNAFDAIGHLEDPWVKIAVAKLNDFVEISITDSGNGIPVELHEKLFDSFFTTKNHKNGTGLGLSICKRIATEYGGSLNIDQACPNTRFVLKLPLKQKQKDPETVAAAESDLKSAA